MKDRWQKLGARFEGLQSRERALVFLAGAVVIVWIIFIAAIDGNLARHKRLAADIAQHRASLVQTQAQTAELIRSAAQDPDKEGRARITAMRDQLAHFDADLRGMQQGLVPPSRMAKVLEDMLTRSGRVQLVTLKTLPVATLVDRERGGNQAAAPAAAGANSGAAERLVYKHGIELTIEGSYLELLDYLARLERLPWQMFWASTNMDASAYPRVRLTITMFTLSLDKAWLVV